jgi:hypothetical protein
LLKELSPNGFRTKTEKVTLPVTGRQENWYRRLEREKGCQLKKIGKKNRLTIFFGKLLTSDVV